MQIRRIALVAVQKGTRLEARVPSKKVTVVSSRQPRGGPAPKQAGWRCWDTFKKLEKLKKKVMGLE